MRGGSEDAGLKCSRLAVLRLSFVALALAGLVYAQTSVSFRTSDGGLISADLYGSGTRAVLLAHGGRFNKASWAPQARRLDRVGFRVLAIDFRGYGK